MEVDTTAEETSLPKQENLEEDEEILSLNLTEEDVQIFEESETILPDKNYPEQDRFDLLESGIKTCRDRIDGFGQQLKFLFVEINIISKFIKEQFGVELIDKASQLRMHIHDVDEIEELTKSLSSKCVNVRRSNRQLAAKWLNEKERRERLRRRKKRFYKDKKDGFGEFSEPYSGGSDIGKDDDNSPFDTKLGSDDSNENDLLEKESVDAESGSVRSNRKRRPGRPPKKFNSAEGEGLIKNRQGQKKEMIKKFSASDEDEEVDQKHDSLFDPDCEEMFSIPKKKRRPRKSGNWDASMGPRKLGRPRKLPEERVSQVSDKTPMQCAECGKILKGPGSLKSHMNMHADLRPHPCLEEGCGKRFRVKNKLNLHMLLHTGDKKEECQFCGKLFYFVKDLARHERTHTGEKPYECSECPKSFNVKQHLTLHLRTHTGERPYPCPTCHKRFSQANSLRIHKKIHLKALVDASVGFLPKKNKNQTKTKNRLTAGSKTSANNILQGDSKDEDEFNFSKMLTVVVETGETSLNLLQTHPKETSRVKKRKGKRKVKNDKAEVTTVELITVNSLNSQFFDNVPKEEEEVNISPGETTVIPIYEVEVEEQKRPHVTVIANRRASLKQQQQGQIEEVNADTTLN